jgi:transposase
VFLTNVAKEGKDSCDAKDILKAYKDQYGIEHNFGFLKDSVITLTRIPFLSLGQDKIWMKFNANL